MGRRLAAEGFGAGPVAALLFTPLEREIVSLIAGGRTVGEIAETITVPSQTVVRHVRVCKRKLGVKSNSELVATAMSSGQLTG